MSFQDLSIPLFKRFDYSIWLLIHALSKSCAGQGRCSIIFIHDTKTITNLNQLLESMTMCYTVFKKEVQLTEILLSFMMMSTCEKSCKVMIASFRCIISYFFHINVLCFHYCGLRIIMWIGGE